MSWIMEEATSWDGFKQPILHQDLSHLEEHLAQVYIKEHLAQVQYKAAATEAGSRVRSSWDVGNRSYVRCCWRHMEGES